MVQKQQYSTRLPACSRRAVSFTVAHVFLGFAVLGIGGCSGTTAEPRTPETPVHDAPRATPIESKELTSAELAAQTLPHVVYLESEAGQGSGFFVSEDLVVTCFHVVRGQARVTLKGAGWQGEAVSMVAWSDADDLALVRVTPAREIGGLKLAQGTPPVGSRLVAVSSPLGLTNTVSDGVVSAMREQPARLQFTAPISPGSSGGPLVDSRGEVVGMVSTTLTTTEQGRTYGQNLNFAVPATRIAAAASNREVPIAVFANETLPDEEKRWRELQRTVASLGEALDDELGKPVADALKVELQRAVDARDEKRLRVLVDLKGTLQKERAELVDVCDMMARSGGRGPALARELLSAWEDETIRSNDESTARLENAKSLARAYLAELERAAQMAEFPPAFAGFQFFDEVQNVYGACYEGYTIDPSPGIWAMECPYAFVTPPFAGGRVILEFLNGRLVAVNMNVNSYKDAVRAVSNKYGEPSFGRFDGKNWKDAKAASFGPNTSFDWDLKGGRIRVGRTSKRPFIVFVRSERDQAVMESF